jgi:hypothetical protein
MRIIIEVRAADIVREAAPYGRVNEGEADEIIDTYRGPLIVAAHRAIMTELAKIGREKFTVPAHD